MSRLWHIAAVAAALLCTSELHAKPTAEELDAANEAAKRGEAMFRYDQAAWHVTDRFIADLANRGETFEQYVEAGLQGYIVEPDDADHLLVTFYGTGTPKKAMSRYRYADNGTIDGIGIVPAGPEQALSALALRMIAARELAKTEMAKPGHDLCSDTRPNTLVLPPDRADVISAYYLTSTTVAGVYPAGGHYRFDIDSSGQLRSQRSFMKSCFPIDTRATEKGKPEMIILTHLLDAQPTEIHTFVSRNIPVALVVGTVSNKRVWAVVNGEITFVKDIDGAK